MWEQLDEVSLREVFAQDVVTTIDPPLVIRQDYIHLQGYALQRFYDTHNDENFTERDQERALKLHLLLSRMLLERIEEHGEEGKAFFSKRGFAVSTGGTGSVSSATRNTEPRPGRRSDQRRRGQLRAPTAASADVQPAQRRARPRCRCSSK